MSKIKLFKLYQRAPDMFDLLIAISSTNKYITAVIEMNHHKFSSEAYLEIMKLIEINQDAAIKLINEIKPGSF